MLILLIGCKNQQNTNIPEEKLCNQDEDCALLKEPCCGGYAVTVNDAFEEESVAEMSIKCVEIECLLDDHLPRHISLLSDARCVKGECILEPNATKVCGDFSDVLSLCQRSKRLARIRNNPQVSGDKEDKVLLEGEIMSFGMSCENILELCEE